MPEDQVLLAIDDTVGYLTLNTPSNMNALNPALSQAMLEGLQSLATDSAVRVIVINGTGRAFMAGGDIRYFAQLLEGPAADRAPSPQMFEAVHAFIRLLRSTGKPVLASVHGSVAGFGVSVVAACDLALASSETVFTLAYRHLGVSPDGGSTWLLPRRIGLKNAFELALLGDRFDAERAADIGLVNRVVDESALAEATRELAAQLKSGPPQALAKAKSLLNESFEHTLEEQLGREEEAFLACVEGPEFAEGVDAFLSKRAPVFS